MNRIDLFSWRNKWQFCLVVFVFIFMVTLLYGFFELLKRYPQNMFAVFPQFNKYGEGIDNIDYLVIHLPNSHQERKKNIEQLREKIGGGPLTVVDAVDGSTVDIKDVSSYDDALVIYHQSERGVGEYGCYLSHFMAIKDICKTRPWGGYTVIFEDDANIITDNFQENITRIINSVHDFDIVFLGNLNDNHGAKYNDVIHYIDKNQHLWGTHAYLVNNRSAEKIYRSLLTMNKQIDNQYKDLVDSHILKGYVIYPILVDQSKFTSTIEI